MVNYQLGKIYKIVDNTNGNIYIGSTSQATLAHRLSKHVSNYKSYLKKTNKNYNTSSFEIFQNENFDIILIELYPCNSKDELHARERYYIETLNCVNKCIPTRTKKEYMKEYCEINKEHIKQRQKNYDFNNKEHKAQMSKQYRFNNKEKIREKKNKKTSCSCGGRYSNSHKTRHEESIKHQNYINNLCTIQS
jgi:hypothetical protein